MPPKKLLENVRAESNRTMKQEQQCVAEVRFRSQTIHLGFKEKPSVEDTLKRMRETKIEDLDQIRFKEWMHDLKGLEFSQILTVPYETPHVRIVSEDPGPKIKFG